MRAFYRQYYVSSHTVIYFKTNDLYTQKCIFQYVAKIENKTEKNKKWSKWTWLRANLNSFYIIAISNAIKMGCYLSEYVLLNASYQNQAIDFKAINLIAGIITNS